MISTGLAEQEASEVLHSLLSVERIRDESETFSGLKMGMQVEIDDTEDSEVLIVSILSVVIKME